MKYRVYVVSAEYSAPLESLAQAADDYRETARALDDSAYRQLFFSAPGDDRSWADIGVARAPTLAELLASAAHRALGSFHELLASADYAQTCAGITDLLVTSMPLLGAMPGSGINSGLIPLMLRSMLGLEFDCHCQFVAGTADSGAAAFTSAARIAQSRPATILVCAGQIVPSGYMGQYRIRSVFTEDEQAQGLDMMAVGDVLMDALRRSYAGPDCDVARVQEWLARVRRRKLEGARAYPASLGITGGNPRGALEFVTPYFRSADVAKVGCGAAAVVMTSDPEVLARIRRGLLAGPEQTTAYKSGPKSEHKSGRYRNTPVVEVMGVGEGTTDPRLLARRSPLGSNTAIRQALVTAADDGALPLSVFPDSAFALVHDPFPSMELAVLLAVGLDWQRATLRMTTWWSNPHGGLLAFGDAVGASGLVHVCKAFHVFTGDSRYIPEPLTALRHFRRAGSYAFTVSIGGPLSHVVVSVLRGGVPRSARDQSAFFDGEPRVPERRTSAAAEHARRLRLRESVGAYYERLASHDPDLRLIEGVTEIDARSCAQALEPEQIDRLSLTRLSFLLADEALDKARAHVRQLVHALRSGLSSAVNSADLYLARTRYNEGLEELLVDWRTSGALRSDAEIRANLIRGAHANEGPANPSTENPQSGQIPVPISGLKALKQCIRVPVALLGGARGPDRELRYMTQGANPAAAAGLDDHCDFARADGGQIITARETSEQLLPWWCARATRQNDAIASPLIELLQDMAQDAKPVQDADPAQVFAALMKQPRALAGERPAELFFLRAYFAPSGPQAAVDLALRDLGVRTKLAGRERADETVPAIFYKNDIIGSSVIAEVHEAYELLGRAVQRARGWFGMYASTCAQHGDSVSLVSLDRRLDPGAADSLDQARHARIEAISNAARFARDVAEWCLGYDIRLRTVVSFGQGVPYRDVNDERSVASDSAIRGARLLDYVTKAAGDLGYAHLPWIVFDATELSDIVDPTGIFEREFAAASGSTWITPAGPSSPVSIERWDDIRFTVWYRR